LIKLCQNIGGVSFLRHRPSSRYNGYGNHTAGAKPMYKLFNVINLELNKVSLYQK